MKHKRFYKSMHQKNICKCSHCENQELYQAENVKDFALHADSFYINFSSYNDAKGNRH